MISWIRQLDDLLRGRRTSSEQLAQGRIDLRLGDHTGLLLALGALYGFFMGWFAIMRTWGTDRARDGAMQMVASVVKLPALFILTLVVTFPSLYVFNALVGARMDFRSTLRLLVAATVVSLAVAASLGPILAFFTLSTDSYPFMMILNVALLGVSGLIGLGFLLKALRRLADAAAQAGEAESSAGDRIFKVWVIIYGLVGAQMGWILRPFIGHPNMTFEWFRPREGNFFAAVVHYLGKLMGL